MSDLNNAIVQSVRDMRVYTTLDAFGNMDTRTFGYFFFDQAQYVIDTRSAVSHLWWPTLVESFLAASPIVIADNQIVLLQNNGTQIVICVADWQESAEGLYEHMFVYDVSQMPHVRGENYYLTAPQ